MDITIEKILFENSSHIFDYAALKSILEGSGYAGVNDKINKLCKRGILEPLKRGLYFHKSSVTENIANKAIISNNLLGPSYVSLDYALSFYGLIPEAVHEVTAVTTKRSKSFTNSYGEFSYRQISKELFGLDLQIETSNAGNFLIASREKVLCDKIYLSSAAFSSKNSIMDFIENNLRIDSSDLESFDSRIAAEYYEISRSKKIKLLYQLLKH